MKLLFDIIVLVIIVVLISYAILAVANLAIFEDLKYIKLLNAIEKAMSDCFQRGRCEEVLWIEDFYYNPVKYSIYPNYTDNRLYLIRCDEPEGKMYFENNGNELYRVFSQNCKVIKRTRPIVTRDFNITIENQHPNISVYTLGIEEIEIVQPPDVDVKFSFHALGIEEKKIKTYSYSVIYYCIVKINNIQKNFEITINSLRKDTGSFLFGDASKTKVGLKIISKDGKCTGGIYELDAKKDLSEKNLLTTPPMIVYIDPQNRKVKFIIPGG